MTAFFPGFDTGTSIKKKGGRAIQVAQYKWTIRIIPIRWGLC